MQTALPSASLCHNIRTKGTLDITYSHPDKGQMGRVQGTWSHLLWLLELVGSDAGTEPRASLRTTGTSACKTGSKRKPQYKKWKHDLGRPAASTEISSRRAHTVHVQEATGARRWATPPGAPSAVHAKQGLLVSVCTPQELVLSKPPEKNCSVFTDGTRYPVGTRYPQSAPGTHSRHPVPTVVRVPLGTTPRPRYSR
ncbi:40S ribosomal protein S8 [Myotis davidii]|uniref:40S ribosomal protein S8 n=1 Tax=Myotis davidii TaxID=225400 RepID=L5MJR4_MYODS|nr:40S ribosomal protein S8 [Myotis davidii]